MLQTSSTGLGAILPKAVQSCLAPCPRLLYNWGDKLKGLVVGICLARSLVLQDIAQTSPKNVKTTENKLSDFLKRRRLKLGSTSREYAIAALKRLGRRAVWKHDGKAAIIIDPTAHAKPRSRRTKRPMPGKGLVRLHNIESDETILVPGYQEIWIGILLKDQTVLPLTRALWSEKGPNCASMNLAELAEIGEACEIVKEALKLDVILVADSGFRRKELLRWLKKDERIDFVIRLEGKLTVLLDEMKWLLEDVAPGWLKRTRILWRKRSKRPLLSDVASRRVSVTTESRERVSFNVVCLTPTQGHVAPMLLATTLTTESVSDLVRIARLYSWRWGIETFFWKFKNSLRGDSWRVFSSWEAIDHLLAAAHMAYMALVLLDAFVRRGKTRALERLRDSMLDVLRTRFARPPVLTQGRFMRLIAMDFPSPCWAGGRV